MLPSPPLRLYTRIGCCLCEGLEERLRALDQPPILELLDVDGDPDLQARYGLRVPVLEIDGVVVMEGRFDGRRLAAALPPAHRPRGPARGPD